MLPNAFLGLFIWMIAVAGAFGGFTLFGLVLKDGDPRVILFGLPVSLALLSTGVPIPRYSIRRIVFEDVPAFGSNPDNIAAVTGLNSIALGVQWAFQGAVVGLAFGLPLTVCVLGSATLPTSGVVCS